MINYLEEQFLSKNLFLNEEFFDVNYLPDKLLHRDQELLMLSKIFIKIIEVPFVFSKKVLIQGEVGIGKTAIARMFSKMLILSAEKRKINLRYIHINCRLEKTAYKIICQILTVLDIFFPKRGFSPQELLVFLKDYLIQANIYLVLILDELNFLDISSFNLIYALTRLNDCEENGEKHISLIMIVKDITYLRNLDESTISTLQDSILTLKKYTKNQIVSILEDRVNSGLKKGIMSNELISYISEEIHGTGDIRKGLNIIHNAVKIAESNDQNQVSLQNVISSLKNTFPSLHNDLISTLNLHQLFLLSSICKALQEKKTNYISLFNVKNHYNQICQESGEKPRKTTQIWLYLQNLKKIDLIKIQVLSKNVRGRSSKIGLKSIPLNILFEELKNNLHNFMEGL
jgi:cell division control protein 6